MFFFKFKYFPVVSVLFAILLFTGCNRESNSGKLKVAAGLPPIAGLVKQIGGDRIEVITMLPAGRTPHDFTPRTDTVRKTSGAKLFFTTGMTFENKIAEVVKTKCLIKDVSRGIKRIAFDSGSSHDHDHDHDSNCSHDDHDPHVWLSPANAIIIASNICEDLCCSDPAGKEYYRNNLKILHDKMLKLDHDIKLRLTPYRNREFFVYHPAFGYFADAYCLKQRAIELNGREATSNQLAAIIKAAKDSNVSTIFVQEQFNPGSAQALARQINGTTASLDPLAEDLTGNFEKITTSLENGFKKENE